MLVCKNEGKGMFFREATGGKDIKKVCPYNDLKNHYLLGGSKKEPCHVFLHISRPPDFVLQSSDFDQLLTQDRSSINLIDIYPIYMLQSCFYS